MAYSIGINFEYDLEKNDDYLRYIININNFIFYFDVVEFYGIDDFKKYGKEEFKDFYNIVKSKNVYLISSFDWDFLKKENDVNVSKLFKVIYSIATNYISEKKPNIIFYAADNKKLHNIYYKMFQHYGYYNLIYKKDIYYFYYKK